MTFCFCVANTWQSSAGSPRELVCGSWSATKEGTIALVVATRAAVDRCGPGTFHHHTASGGQNVARAGEEDHELNCTAEIPAHPPHQVAGTVYFAMDVDEVPAAGAPDDPGSLPCLVRRSGFSGTSWSRSPTPCQPVPLMGAARLLSVWEPLPPPARARSRHEVLRHRTAMDLMAGARAQITWLLPSLQGKHDGSRSRKGQVTRQERTLQQRKKKTSGQEQRKRQGKTS